jgi:hypothetical protein
MRCNCRLAVLLCGAAAVLISTSSASGQFSGLQQTLLNGIEHLDIRNFISQPQGGPFLDFNIYEQRLEYNRTGDGYTFENVRFFGPDSFNNPNTIDLGPLKIQLGGVDPAILASGQPVGISNRLGYTTRFIPELFFNTTTGQRAFDQFSGLSTFAPAPLRYNISMTTGVQDFEWSGSARIDSSGQINAMGFYKYNLQFTNIGSQTADGALVQNEQVTDFDVGPIDVEGNLFMDVLAGFLQIPGQTAAAVPPRIFSAASGKTKSASDLARELNEGATLTDEEMQFLVQQMLANAIRSDPIGFAMNGMPSQIPGFEGLNLDFTPSETSSGVSQATVPEPGTLLLLAMAGVTLCGFTTLRSGSFRLRGA